MSGDAGRTTKVTWDTAEEREEMEAYARARKVPLPRLMKMAMDQYRTKNPIREKRPTDARLYEIVKNIVEAIISENKAQALKPTAEKEGVADVE